MIRRSVFAVAVTLGIIGLTWGVWGCFDASVRLDGWGAVPAGLLAGAGVVAVEVAVIGGFRCPPEPMEKS